MTPKEFSEQFHIELNEQQTQAMQQIDGPTLLLAVPGSGKTTVLIARLGYMIYCRGIDPAGILTLTYTTSAAYEMAKRFELMFGGEFSGQVRFSTINSLCHSIIHFFSRKAGKRPFGIESDEKVLGGLIARLYRKYEPDNQYPVESEIRLVRSLITFIKNMQLREEEIGELGQESRVPLLEIYREYQSEMRARGKMDFDDQMVYALNILRRSPETLAHYRRKYRYVCVDEAQDTSKIQHEIIALLAEGSENLFMVGDEDQSIYGFRAAYPQALLEFEQRHPNAKVLLMEENFRSTKKIVDAADRLIRNNQFRHEKHMRTANKVGRDVRRIDLKARKAQYSYLLKVAESCSESPSGTTAVLYRNNESGIPLIDLLEREGIPYNMPARDMLFFSNRTVIDIRNIMCFAMDPGREDLFLQIYYKLNLYLTKAKAEEACRISRRKGISILDALIDFGKLSKLQIPRVKALRTNLKRLLEEAPSAAISRILNAVGYKEYLENNEISDDKILLLRFLAAREESCEGFLKRLDYLKELIQTKPDAEGCPFVLSTIHAAKGLEYDHVYLIDCVNGIFPAQVPESRCSKSELETFEEERRMYYVAVTRAKESLAIFHLPTGCVFTEDLLGKKPAAEQKKQPAKKQRQIPEDPFSGTGFQDFQDSLGAGIPVIHKKFGEGVVVDTADRTVKIHFEGIGEKELDMGILFLNKLLRFPE